MAATQGCIDLLFRQKSKHHTSKRRMQEESSSNAVRRCEGIEAKSVFQFCNMVVIHKESFCDCHECHEIKELLGAHGGAVCERSVIQRKKNTLLDFLQEDETYVVIHHHTKLSQATQHLETPLNSFSSHCKHFSWVKECVRQGRLLQEAEYIWKEAEKEEEKDEAERLQQMKKLRGIERGGGELRPDTAPPPRPSPPSDLKLQLALHPCKLRRCETEFGQRKRRGHTSVNEGRGADAEQEMGSRAPTDRCDRFEVMIQQTLLPSDEEEEVRGGGDLKQGDTGPEKEDKRGGSCRMVRTQLERSGGMGGRARMRGAMSRTGKGVELTSKEAKEVASVRNRELLMALKELEETYATKGDQWREMAYRKAIAAISKLEVELTEDNLRTQLAGRPGLGSSIRDKIEELFKTGKIAKLEFMKSDPNLRLLQELKCVWGVGDKLALRLIEAGVRSVEELRGRERVGEGSREVRLPTCVRIGVEHNDDINTKMPRDEVAAMEEAIRQHAQRVGGASVEVVACGSYRRGKQESGDIDCLLTRKDGGCGVEVVEKLMTELETEFDPFKLSTLARCRSYSSAAAAAVRGGQEEAADVPGGCRRKTCGGNSFTCCIRRSVEDQQKEEVNKGWRTKRGAQRGSVSTARWNWVDKSAEEIVD
eukprot:765549-Hanusia_phi.AAC.2